MPELPEIETARRIIEPQIDGQTVSSMSRRGKFLTVHFESGDRLSLHLRMTGQLLVTPADFPEEKHTHLVFCLSGDNRSDISIPEGSVGSGI